MPSEPLSGVKFEIGHVLFIDIVGYSKLLINEQSEQIQRLKEIVRGTEQFRLAEAEGKLLRLPTGDGGALVFRTSPEAPVLCALEISKALKSHPELRVRMGIHSGPVNEVTDLNEQANIAGAGINIAQRVMDCGDAGHILVSKRVADDLEQYPQWRSLLHELGECEVKHGLRISLLNLYTSEAGNPALPEKLRAHGAGAPSRRKSVPGPGAGRLQTLLRQPKTMLLAGAIVLIATAILVLPRLGRKTTPAVATPQSENGVSSKSIAVLPFADLSQAKDQEYFCDGISEEILDALSKIEGLRVVARTSSFSFKGKNLDVAEIGKKLNVQHVLEGSLRRDGNRIRVTAQLVDARNGYHLWSEKFERELQGVFALQDEITRAIVDALRVKLAVAQSARPQQNTEAYDLYLQGLYFSNKSGEEDLRKALDLFQRALEKDPAFGRAWTGIAQVWLWLADAYVKPLEAYPAMKAAALKAISLDEKDADAHCYLVEAKRILDWNLADGEAELNRALQLDPNSAFAYTMLASFNAMHGELDRAVVRLQEAKKLDPVSPNVSYLLSGAYLDSGRLEEAMAEGRRTLILDPSYFYPALDYGLAAAYREKGMFAEAIALYSKVQEATHFPSRGLAITYARMGRPAEGRRILNQLVEKAQIQYVAGDSIAAIYVALGENDEAFRWLERAYIEHAANLHTIAYGHEFRPLRSDPRYADLLRRSGLDPLKVIGSQKVP